MNTRDSCIWIAVSWQGTAGWVFSNIKGNYSFKKQDTNKNIPTASKVQSLKHQQSAFFQPNRGIPLRLLRVTFSLPFSMSIIKHFFFLCESPQGLVEGGFYHHCQWRTEESVMDQKHTVVFLSRLTCWSLFIIIIYLKQSLQWIKKWVPEDKNKIIYNNNIITIIYKLLKAGLIKTPQCHLESIFF